MLTERDGGVFLEWDQILLHGTKVKFLLDMVKTSQLHFTRTSDWVDLQESVTASPLADDEGIPKKALATLRRQHPGVYGHCWTIARKYDLALLVDNRSERRDLAIVTNFRSLYDSVRTTDVFGGQVVYRDFERFRDIGMSSLSNFGLRFVKDEFFISEREFRMIVELDEGVEEPGAIRVDVDIPMLIHQVIVRRGVPESDFQELRDCLSDVGLADRLIRHPTVD